MNQSTNRLWQFMESLGVSQTETKLYLKLLELGPSSMYSLAKLTKTPRTTTFENIAKLLEKGLVSKTALGSKEKLVAADPIQIKLLLTTHQLKLEKQQDELEKLGSQLPNIVKLIHQSIPKAEKNTEVAVRYYEGKRAVWSVYKEMLEADKVASFANLDRFYEIYPNTRTAFVDALKRNKNREVYAIAVDSVMSRNIAAGHGRYFCKTTQFETPFMGLDCFIYDSKVVMVQLAEESAVLAVKIESDLIAAGLRMIHAIMWQLIAD